MVASRYSSKRIPFTHSRVSTFECPPGKPSAFLWDAQVPGLGLRALASGGASFIFQKKLNGKQIRIVIGNREYWSLSEARAEARRLGVLVDRGIDPRGEKAQRQQEAETAQQAIRRGLVTVGEAWECYTVARHSDWRESTRNMHRTAMKPRGILFALHSTRLSELSADDVVIWIETEKAHRPTQTRLGYALLRAFLFWAAEQPDYAGLINPAEVLNKDIRRRIPPAKVKSDCLQKEQLRAWFTAVRGLENQIHAIYLQVLLLTGARSQEIAGLQWGDVDFQWNAITIKDKIAGQRVVPLTPYVAELLNSLPRHNEWVFASSTSKTGHIKTPNHAHNRALQMAGLPHITLHGLRRSFGTLAEWVECPVGVTAQIMGHSPSALAEKHYRRRPLDLLRLWHTKIEDWILDQAGVRS